eukprot:TRINITY_DN7720_c0_g2_i1.p1 TRINITY_DN7720_c0_g2~~TRINITY_DN7720_c0_g2_i1.p1  ORF type:complete len:147 (+),score=16.60 TRINITY_DN7720_c0_g2_i1:22-441(+)
MQLLRQRGSPLEAGILESGVRASTKIHAATHALVRTSNYFRNEETCDKKIRVLMESGIGAMHGRHKHINQFGKSIYSLRCSSEPVTSDATTSSDGPRKHACMFAKNAVPHDKSLALCNAFHDLDARRQLTCRQVLGQPC